MFCITLFRFEKDVNRIEYEIIITNDGENKIDSQFPFEKKERSIVRGSQHIGQQSTTGLEDWHHIPEILPCPHPSVPCLPVETLV